MNVSAYLMGLLICISLVIRVAEHLFMCLSAICRLSSEKYPFWSLALFFFFLGLYVFFILNCMSYLYVLEMNSSCVSSFANISSYSEGCPFVSLRVSFWYAKAFKVNSVLFSDLWFTFIFLRCRSTKNLLHSCQIVSCLYLSQEFHSVHPYNTIF